ncbi:putative leucine-rich repeat domain, L domain-containing protein [Rosa chinensis]|uniref:Putative leucine-rich repeat domain, L domain-containing protein n=2 Tax=Rosa chinensis TaxID=74649 RepID=A0A2P6RPY5_ROSCH|nr:putative leucine-rich repeat domain, L domain-containing protein [Rosa chinensis]
MGKEKESDVIANIRRSYEDLDGTELKVCLLSLSIFPENNAIKKRPLIYWWIGEGFITSTKEKRAEEIGEEIFEKLMRKDLIQPGEGEPNCELLVKSCTMHPWIRRMLISLASEARLFHFDSIWPMMPSYSIPTWRRACLVSKDPVKVEPIPEGAELNTLLTLFNVNVQYLDLEQKRLEELKKVEVLQLGRWQNSPTHHIELEHRRSVGASSAEGILNGLGAQKYLKYLSLRGISRITQLPDSILSLISLEILDLRACHDLERLPSDISSLKKLTHLDVSECFLLEGMPKGLQKLASLQVLKGFLIGTLKKTPCRLGELAKLKNLRRLSIHLGNEASVQQGEFTKLEGVSSLRHLKISWGVLSSNFKKDIDKESGKLSFPSNLEKLDLQGLPISNLPEGLKPSKLKKLKKLYIMGGELNSLSHGETNEHWKVEILRLHFLKKLKSPGLERLKREFPCMQYCAVSKLLVDEQNNAPI